VRAAPAAAVLAAFVLAGLVLAGCGGAVASDPGDPQARRVLAFAAHGRQLEDRLGGTARAVVHRSATARETRNTLAELLPEATRLREDIASTVPDGAPGRVPTLEGARELQTAALFLHSYASGHAAGLPLASRHVAGATRAFAGAAGALRPFLGEAQEETLAHLEAPAPALR
jgi:hypothetical protein